MMQTVDNMKTDNIYNVSFYAHIFDLQFFHVNLLIPT